MGNTKYRMILVLLFTFIFCACANAFALHKRSADVTSSENHLADALKVIQREKRRAIYDDLGGRQWRNEDDYYDDDWERPYPVPLPGYNSYDMQQLGDLFSSDKYNFGNDKDNYRPIGDINPDDFLESDDMGDVETGDDEGAQNVDNEVSEEELQDIFTDAPPKLEKRTDGKKEQAMLNEALLGPAGKRNTDKREYDPSIDKKSSDSVKLSDLSPAQMNALIQTVEEDAKNGITEDMTDEDERLDDQVEVSDEEINDIFGPGGYGEDDNGEEETTGNSDAFSPEGANKEWLMAQYLDSMQENNGGAITKKKKRSQGSLLPPMTDIEGMSSVYGGDSPADMATELAIAREDIKVLRAFLAKEDAENAHLSHALSLATKSQTERTDKYVGEEIDYIKQAIQDELDIQEVKDVLHIASSLDAENGGMSPPFEEDEEEIVRDEFELSPFMLPLEDKRADPEMDGIDEVDVPDQGDIIDDDMTSDVTNGDMIDMNDQDLVKVLLAGKLQKLLRQGSPGNLGRDSMSPNDLSGWYDQPVVPSAEDFSNQEDWYLNPLMRELWQKYRTSESAEKRGYPPQGEPEPVQGREAPMDLNTLEQILVQSLADQAPEGQEICPAVEELSTQCGFLAELGLELDDEATELCNRHQMCYNCGSTLDFTADDCDRGYLEEAARLCEAKNSCDKDASRLFILMLRYHDFQQSDVPPQCAEACAEEYISGSISRK